MDKEKNINSASEKEIDQPSASEKEMNQPSFASEKELNQSSASEQEMNQSSSSSADMRDWELLESDILNYRKELLMEANKACVSENGESPSGLFVHGNLPRHSGVEELIDRLHHTDSNSSSDIDVIDENLEDSQSNLSIQSLDTSRCSCSDVNNTSISDQVESSLETRKTSVGTSTQEPPLENIAEDGMTQEQTVPPEPLLHNRFNLSFLESLMTVFRYVMEIYNTFQPDRMTAKEFYLIGFVVSVCFVVPCTHLALNKASWQEAKLEQMEGHVNKLISENERLKNKVLEKIESGSLLGDLDDEVKGLKSENFKLHKAMQTVIQQLEEQTHAIKKGLELKENAHKDPYKKEISKLKEQINMLRIDNEELQKQLVRIRYGRHAANRDDSEREKHKNLESHNSAQPDPRKVEDSFEHIKERREEILELRKKLNEEVSKLKLWKESLEEFVQEIEKPQANKEDYLNKESFEKKPYTDSKKGFKHEKSEEDKYKHKKNRKFYDWSWKDIKKNFKGTLGNFPDMITNYMTIDKEKVAGVMDTISHYYKKAQDKTKKILKKYSVDEKTQNIKEDIWTLMGEMKNKWVDVKNNFMETHFGNSEGKVQSDNPEEVTQNVPTDSNKEQNKMPESFHDILVDESRNIQSADDETVVDVNNNELENSMQSVKEVNELLKEAQRRFSQQNSNINSWIFERAQHRAELREEEEESDGGGLGLNWFLKRSKFWQTSTSVENEEKPE